MPDRLPPCDPEIHKNGKLVFFTHNINSLDFEKWVKGITVASSLPVDWHVYGGRQLVLTLSPVDEVVSVMLDPLKEQKFDDMYEQSRDTYFVGARPYLRSLIKRTASTRSDSLWGENEYARTLKLLRA